MSRHKHAYDDDDMYDYDDYDDYDDEDYNNYKEQQTYSTPASAPAAVTVAKDEGLDYVQFVMEALGKVEVTPTGQRMTGNVSEARVVQMLSSYDYDIEATIGYFQKQREASQKPATKSTTTKPPTAPPVPAKPIQKAGTEKGTQNGSKQTPASVGKAPSKSTKQAEPENVASVSSTDVTAMGFSEDPWKFSGQPPVVRIGKGAAASPSPQAITLSAPLSDDELDVSGDLKPADDGGERSRPHITMVVAGHVDAGKSTLVGNLLYKVGSVAQRMIHKYEKESQQTGKGSFALAWVMDESLSEREHGVTIDIAERYLQTKHRSFTILDAPGHRDFIPNMISGAAQADVALLVIPASTGEYESCMSNNAQTREHAVLLKALGVNQIIVVVNKMDSVSPPWCQQRFMAIEAEVRALLDEINFAPKAIRFVPLSGLSGENLVTLSDNCALRSWYKGKTLIQAMDSFREPRRRVVAPLRAMITSVTSENAKGCDVSVRVLQGKLRVNRGVGLASAAGAATVKKLFDNTGGAVEELRAGCKGSAQLIDRSNRSGEEMGLSEGMVLCKGPPLPTRNLKFKATVHTLANLQPPMIAGSSYELYLHGEVAECRVTKLYSMRTNSTGSVGSPQSRRHKTAANTAHSPHPSRSSSSIESASESEEAKVVHPKCVPGGRCAKVKIEVTHSVCIEPFKVCDALGRFALRAKGKTCAVGICEKLPKKDKVTNKAKWRGAKVTA